MSLIRWLRETQLFPWSSLLQIKSESLSVQNDDKGKGGGVGVGLKCCAYRYRWYLSATRNSDPFTVGCITICRAIPRGVRQGPRVNRWDKTALTKS